MTPQEQQDKARFFGQHIGCNVLIDTDMVQINAGCVFRKPNSQSKIPPMPFLNFYTPEQVGAVSMCAVDRCNLILRSLSDITDAEAVECIEISNQPFGALKQVDASNRHVVFEDTKGNLLSLTNLSEKTKVADYLRSKNFALPFMGQCPIEKKWAVLEATNQPTGANEQQ